MNVTLSRLPLLLLIGCALQENFVPTEHATGLSPEGHAAADYELVVDGERLGDVAIWTNGAKLIRAPNDTCTALYVTYQVDNTGEEPLGIEPETMRIRAGDRTI